jgi:hypothetical protein
MPPASSKKRSTTTVDCVGTAPRAARGAPRVQGRLLGEPAHRGLGIVEARGDRLAHRRHLGGQLPRARGPLPEPEGHGGRRAAGVLHADLAALDPADAPGAIAQEDDVTRHGLDGEVLVQRADGRLVGLEHHLVAGGVGNGAARGDRGQPRAASAPQPPPHRIAVKPRAHAPPPRGDALRQHVHHRVEVPPLELGIRRRAPDQGEERVFVLLPLRADGNQLLGQDIEWGAPQGEVVDLRPPGRP